VIIQIRQRLGCPLTDYQRMRMPKDYESPGRALTPAEETKVEQIFKTAADNPKLKTGALASLLSMKCGAGPGEIKSLRLKDVCLTPPQIVIPKSGAKREHRERKVPLEGAAVWALERLLARAAKECGCSVPDHYLIPRRNRDHSYDPTRPSQGWRSSLDHLLGVAEIEIRPYDFRHHAVSRALSDPRVSLEAAKAYFGWISRKMIARYYHADGTALKTVAAAIDGARAERVTQALCNQDVITMLGGGLDVDIVIETIRGSFCGFDVSCQILMQLKKSGVPAAVIKEMVKANPKPIGAR
jgi:integrase